MRNSWPPWVGPLLACLAGCSENGSETLTSTGGTASSTGGATSAATGGATSAATGGATSTATGGAASAAYPKACSDIYNPQIVPVFELEIAPSELALLEQDCQSETKQYRAATFRYGAETAAVMVRLKGNWSFRCEKKQFVISFNEVDPSGRFHGQRKIVLDAPWYDPSLLAERLGFSFMQRTGNPWSCVNHARLQLNGQYYGAYANVERLDKEYLQRHFTDAEAEGNLYEGGVELKTNETLADTSRRDALTAANTVTAIDALTDLEQAVKVWAASAMLPDPDSYWAGVEINHYLYDHPTRGFMWLPVDMDLTMRQGITDAESSSIRLGVEPQFVNADPLTYQNPDWDREPLYRTVLSDAAWCGRFLEALKLARDAYDVAAMSRELDTWAAQIADAVAQDTRKPFTQSAHLASIATLKAFMPQRLAFVNNWLLSATCPVTRWPR